jgi:hypothetical protein
MESVASSRLRAVDLGCDWVGLRDRLAVPASIVLSICLVIMWWGNIASLISKGGFTGIGGWLIPGIVVVLIRGWLLSKRLLKEWHEAAWTGRRRLLWQLIPTVGNVAANSYAIYLVVHNVQIGVLDWTRWDNVCCFVAVGAVVVMIGLRLVIRKMSPKLFVAGVGVGTRAFQQGMLTLSPQMQLILWGTPVGLSGIASLQFFLSLIEFRAAKQEDTAGVWEARLLVWSDGSNLAAALVLLAGWLVTLSTSM